MSSIRFQYRRTVIVSVDPAIQLNRVMRSARLIKNRFTLEPVDDNILYNIVGTYAGEFYYRVPP